MNYGKGGVQRNTVEDFWNKVNVGEPDACWNWTEGTWHNGYGRFKWNYQSWRAHRFALVATGKIPEGCQDRVRHLCHNRFCCNPAHLVWGTHTENMLDKAARHLPAHNRKNPAGITQS